MPQKTWILCDADTGRYIDACRIGAGDVTGVASPFTLAKRRLHGGMRDGVDVVEIDNGRLRLTLVPTRGMGIHRGECDTVRLGWTSPVRTARSTPSSSRKMKRRESAG